MRLLLVEDNTELASWLAKTLALDGFAVECSYDGQDALYRLQTQTYDIVILDLDLPKLDGRSILRHLRSQANPVPVLILTASTGLQSRVDGLNAGADDYLGKPFEIAELLARIRVLLRRARNQPTPYWSCGDLLYDSNTRQFKVGGAEIKLTPREHAVLEMLMMQVGKTVSKESLFNSLYSVDELVAPDAIEIYVHRLRKKLVGCSATIVTLRGLGYLLRPKSD